ncbi:hypothetical protein F5Y04DRAFT_262759 [Hypomontagnella monticulosa]|nr:hypothetical protein F5Y04DRAFT_262759 [Hypomontagnella monticulosa]
MFRRLFASNILLVPRACMMGHDHVVEVLSWSLGRFHTVHCRILWGLLLDYLPQLVSRCRGAKAISITPASYKHG